jgi:signal peptidase I
MGWSLPIFKIAKVSGDSMSPNFHDGDFVIALRWPGLRLQPGQAVLVDHPIFGLIIKRIKQINTEAGGQPCYQLTGDNPASTSSETLGWITPKQIFGRVVWHIQPKFNATTKKYTGTPP